MFNGNKIELNEELNSINENQENKLFKNYHYINNHNQTKRNIPQKDYSFDYHIDFNTNYDEDLNFYDKRKIYSLSSEKINSNKLTSRDKENRQKKHNMPNYLYNIDLNKLSTNNHKNIDISLLSSNSFINNNKQNNINNSNKKEISPEKYLDDILKKNETDFQNNYNKIIIQTLSSENNDNKNNSSILTNSIRSSSEFDFFKNTLNKTNNLVKNNKLQKINNKTNNIDTKENKNEKNILYEVKEPKDNSKKIINHDDIPIMVNTSNFMELVEKELANENLNNSRMNNKSFDISTKAGIEKIEDFPKNLSFSSEKDNNNEKNIVKGEKMNDDEVNKKEKKIKIIKIMNKKNNNEIRSKTPENLIIKRFNKKKFIKNKKINFNQNIPQTSIPRKIDIEKGNNNNNISQSFNSKKINNIINNNSITIISHFDIEENSIKKTIENNKKILLKPNEKNENKDKNDSIDKDITNYIDNFINDYDENKSIQKKINELNYELNKYKEERNNINKIKNQYEKLNNKLLLDLESFKKEKSEFEKYKKAELEKIKIQKIKYLSDNKIIKNLKSENELLNKKVQKDKEIIESLKNQLSEYQNQNKLNKKIIKDIKNNYNYEFQFSDHNNYVLHEILNTIDISKNKVNKKDDKLYRNKSALAIKYVDNQENKLINANKIRMHTAINENYNTNIKNKKTIINNYILNQDKSFDKSDSNKKNKINMITEDNNINNNKTYEDKFYPRKIRAKNIKNNIPLRKKSDLNILTQEKYRDIIKLINNSLRKNTKAVPPSSPDQYYSNDLYLKKDKNNILEKKFIYKSKSNLNFNNNIKVKNKPLSHVTSLKRNSTKIESENNISNNKKELIIEDKLILEDYEFKIPEKYKNKKYSLIKSLKSDDKIINIYNDNKKEIIFPSGVRKEIFNDGYQIVYFVNGDMKQNYPDGKSIYYFYEAKTVQTTFNNGVMVFKFGNNQIERHYPDGKKQILFPDGSERIILSNGYEETHFKDGRIVKTNNNGKSITENI